MQTLLICQVFELLFTSQRIKTRWTRYDLFTLTRSATSFPEKTTAKDGKKFMGYFATHYLVKLKTAPPDSTDARYADTKVEIQVASVLMHAWAEVEHDLEYKPESGTISEDESTILDEVNRSEEHTSELQSLRHLVCRLLLEKK